MHIIQCVFEWHASSLKNHILQLYIDVFFIHFEIDNVF